MNPVKILVILIVQQLPFNLILIKTKHFNLNESQKTSVPMRDRFCRPQTEETGEGCEYKWEGRVNLSYSPKNFVFQIYNLGIHAP